MSAHAHSACRTAFLAFLLVPLLVQAQGEPAQVRPGEEHRHLVEINTTLGRMVVELYNETPQHRDNFLKLVHAHYYDSTLFHRVIPQFMVQGGDPDSRKAPFGAALGNGGPGYTLPAELNKALIHTKGALAAAPQDDQANPEKRSSGSQFYIVEGREWTAPELTQLVERKKTKNPAQEYGYTPEQVAEYVRLGGTPHLDGDHTVFGRVIEGLDVLDRIAQVDCNGLDRPMTDVRMWMRELP